MVAVIPDIQTQEDLLQSTGVKFGIKAFFKQMNLAWMVAVIVKLRLAKNAIKCKLYKERNHTEGHVLIVIITNTYFFLKSTL